MQAGDRIVRHGGQFYNFEGLRRFKDKFDPDWRPREFTQRPNIVMVVLDDVGFADLGCYGSSYASTPRIDRLAREGIKR